MQFLLKIASIQLLNNKVYGLSPSGCHHSLLFDQERHLTVLCMDEIIPSHVVIRLNSDVTEKGF